MSNRSSHRAALRQAVADAFAELAFTEDFVSKDQIRKLVALLKKVDEAAITLGVGEHAAFVRRLANAKDLEGVGLPQNHEHVETLKRELDYLSRLGSPFDFAVIAKYLGTAIAVVSGIMSIVDVKIDLAVEGQRPAPADNQVFINATQLGIICLFAISAWRRVVQLRKTAGTPQASSTDRIILQFSRYYLMIWSSWVVLYLVLIISHGKNSAVVSAFIEMANSGASYAFLMCFLVLDRPSVEMRPGDRRDTSFRRLQLLAGLAWAICVGTTFACNLPPVADVIGAAGVRAGRLPAALFAGIAMCLFIGRIDSRFLKVHRAQITLLYCYAVIQFAWPVLGKSETSDALVFPSAVLTGFFVTGLVGKIVLAQVIDHMHVRGEAVFRDYVVNIRKFLKEENAGDQRSDAR